MDKQATLGDRRVRYVRLDDIVPAARNPKGHDLMGIRASISRFGYVAPSVLDERTSQIVAGNGRMEALRAMRDDGESPPAGVTLDHNGQWLVPIFIGWSSRSDAEADAYLIADNEWTVRGGWDEAGLAELLGELASGDPDLLEITGFTADDLSTLLAGLADESDMDDDGDGEASGDGNQLASLAGVTIGEPEYTVKTGERWWMGEHHVLVVASPHTGWPKWIDLLEGNAILLPFPSPNAAVSKRPEGARMVLL